MIDRQPVANWKEPFMSEQQASLNLQVTREKLLQLMDLGGEADSWDFKEELDLSTKKGKATLTRHVLAFANTGGGHIVLGVTDEHEPVGLPQDYRLDTTVVYKAISSYTDANITLVAAQYPLESLRWEGIRHFGLIYVQKYLGIAIPSCVASFTDERGKVDKVLHPTDILVRRGAQSCIANQAEFDRLIRGQNLTATTDEEQSQDEQQRSLEGYLPPREEIVDHFVGRRNELAQLWAWFKDPYRRRWLLAGDGGKGKTAIAYEFATQLQAVAPPEYASILWLSAKRLTYVEGAIRPIEQPDFSDLPSLLDAILLRYGFDEYLDLPPAEKRSEVMHLLRDLPALIVADDVDSLDPSEEAALEFLTSDIAGTASKALLTSRRVPGFGWSTSHTQVEGMEGADATSFIESRVRNFHLDAQRFPERIVGEIIDVTDGSPLYITDLLRSCDVLPIREAITIWKDKGGGRSPHLFFETRIRLPIGKRKEYPAHLLHPQWSHFAVRNSGHYRFDTEPDSGRNAGCAKSLLNQSPTSH